MAKTAGRRKIELKLIENERERAVTLSKRHDGLFKKACELATLCGAQIAIILFTISGKPLAVGSPTVANVVDKFLDLDRGENNVIRATTNSLRKAKLRELNQEFNEFNEKFATERKHGQTLEEDLKVSLGGKTYEDCKSNIGIDNLLQIKCRLEQLKRDLQHGCYAESGSSSFEEDYEMDLSKIEGPRDYLKL
ncbi:putative transcription factor MADS-type1 family [Helianthus annuus]|uniref:Putative transcription factor, MADS-box n=1 Tax=Helianthus annuus TaxID=4232 RepID=A0A251V794_HELAN|nr:agamous-like MADS-box protein AGL29 [Helianthus annuus]KAF5782091.1 putative transcription factor MADS-type1 family [Helianthus annuus]KAJ0501624.1 putative transcription factor MADS-type1 family [Helianthus annuus]KAJ0509467.1 putative transcription factor MADS-type1 family [Helianthus annuus]KAJ0517530.1 putative transcription factor MADS-type1 family [Helianthus annuus]KAJ0685540.1 putative transcription factor MADS-type1 family [Helianthus annuus]